MGISNCCKTFLGEKEHEVSTFSPYSKVYGRRSTVVINPSQFVLENSRTLRNDYKVEKTLGEGAYGIVYKATHTRSGEKRAIKWIDRTKIVLNSEASLKREVDILRHLDHPNIMKIFEFAEDSNGYSIISEFIAGGELLDAIAVKNHFPETDAAYIMRQLLAAIAYCHSRNIIHRDLKPENVLIDTIENEKVNIKIIDFGTALTCPPSRTASEKVGTVYYVAPEVLRGNYTSKCDVWSLGVIMYLLLSGQPPFNGNTDQDIIAAVTRGVFTFPSRPWDSISPEAKDLITKMLTYDPERRITAAEALSHSWFQNCASIRVDPVQAQEVLENIKGFNAKSKLQKAAMMFIVAQLMTKQEKDELKKVFLSLDKDANGRLTRAELVEGYTRLLGDATLAVQHVDEVLKFADMNKTGDIDYSEFLVAAANKKKLLSLSNVKEAFNAFDLNRDGYISSSEIKTMLSPGKGLEEKVWRDIVSEVDTNGDGVVSYAEFEAMMQKHLA